VLGGVLAQITNNLRETNVELREENPKTVKKTPSEFLRGSTLLHEREYSRAIAILPEATARGRCTIAYDAR
jgi:hypothetical protein